METISVKEFYKRVSSFYEKMGTKMPIESYEGLIKMIGLSYLNVDQTDSEYSPLVAETYMMVAREYDTRMSLMGYEV